MAQVETYTAVVTAALLLLAVVASLVWRDRQLRQGINTLHKLLEAGNCQSKTSLDLARFGAWGVEDPAAELEDVDRSGHQADRSGRSCDPSDVSARQQSSSHPGASASSETATPARRAAQAETARLDHEKQEHPLSTPGPLPSSMQRGQLPPSHPVALSSACVAPVTTTHVLRSADGRRNTAFHVLTTWQ